MKILLAVPYPSDSTGILQFYRRAFIKLGHDVKLVAISEQHSFRDRLRYQLARFSYSGLQPDWFGEALIQAADCFQPDLTIIGRAERLLPEPIRYLRERSPLGCINIYPDSPLVIPGKGAVGMLASLAEYSSVYTFSRTLVPVFYQLGARCVHWLPFGFDPETHRISPSSDSLLQTTVAYLGAWGPLQEAWLEPQASLGVGIYGPGWQHLRSGSPLRTAWRKGRGIGTEMSSAIAGADMVFNLVRAEHGCAHSMKTFEIPACGGFMLTNWTEEQAEFFEDGKHCVFFRTREEMLEKAIYFSTREYERIKIAVAGNLEASKHPYTTRAAQILKNCK
jgi:spore maturation protein CgeB